MPYAKRRPELAGLLEAEHVLLVRQSAAWRELMLPVCLEIDAERPPRLRARTELALPAGA